MLFQNNSYLRISIMDIIGMRTRLDYGRIYYRMSTYLQAVTCLLSQILAIACSIDVRGVCNEEKQHKRCGVIRNILNID